MTNALHDLYNKYATDIYRFALGLTGDPAWADDITAETFVRALLSAGGIRTETVRGYLFTIARNLYLEELRKEKRLTYLDDEVANGRFRAPEAAAEIQDELRQTLAGLQLLNESERTALLLRVQNGLPYSDIAQTLNISLSAAKVKVHRARLKLARQLRKETI